MRRVGTTRGQAVGDIDGPGGVGSGAGRAAPGGSICGFGRDRQLEALGDGVRHRRQLCGGEQAGYRTEIRAGGCALATGRQMHINPGSLTGAHHAFVAPG
jgi:hypothetical protein